MLSVLRPSDGVAATNLWFFDSGDVECEGRNVNNNGCVDPSQLAWLRNHPAPRAFGLAWVHIPVPEVMAVWANTNSTGHCHDTICCSAINPGLYSELLRRGDVRALFSGHDHYNDYCECSSDSDSGLRLRRHSDHLRRVHCGAFCQAHAASQASAQNV